MKLEPGQIVRYAPGPTALAQVTSVLPGVSPHAGQHGYGDHCLGGAIGFWSEDCTLATRDDINEAKASHFWALGDI